MADHAFNSPTLQSSQVYLFYINYNCQLEKAWQAPKCKMTNIGPLSEVLESSWKGTWEHLQCYVLRVEERQTKWYDKNQKPGLEFQGRNQVLSDCQNIWSKRMSFKLDFKKYCSFNLVAEVGSFAYWPMLLALYNITMYSMLLLQYYQQLQDWKMPIIPPQRHIVQLEEYRIVKEVDIWQWNRVHYWVLWKRYQHEEETWETCESQKWTSEVDNTEFQPNYSSKSRYNRIRIHAYFPELEVN